MRTEHATRADPLRQTVAPSVLTVPRTQAGTLTSGHAPGVPAEDTMIFWLARAARTLREQAGRKQVHVAAELGIDQATIYRFEEGTRWPRHADDIVAAYARDLDIDDPREIWRLAVDMWLEHGEAPMSEDVTTPRAESGQVLELARQAFGQAIDAGSQAQRSGSGRRSRTSRAKGSRRAAG